MRAAPENPAATATELRIRGAVMRFIKYKRIFAVLLAPIAIVLATLAQHYPTVTESVYSQGVYPYISGVLSWLFGWFPFSVVEVALLLLIIGGTTYIIYMITLIINDKRGRGNHVLALISTVLCATSVLYFVFISFCGLNYHRESFAVHSGLTVRASSTKELEELCAYLVEETNALREQVAEDENGVMRLSFTSDYQTAAFAPQAYQNIYGDYPVLEGFNIPRAKPVLLSRGMSHLNLAGVFSPFTFEANVNVDLPDYSIPSSMLHELAHYKGYMREDEANFLAYLAGKSCGNPDFAYSSMMLALIHSSNALYKADSDAYYAIVAQGLSNGVKRDLAANQAYWREFEGPAAQVSTTVNNVYLRTNNQKDGVQSYGRMVDLLLAEYRQVWLESVAEEDIIMN